ncbi:MAG TPA: endonuclease/exonuclease/phosphatase family protein [Lacipirellulaceae bacterium]|nr:endonuclease/exonuclease/phosphatase family protein [Lacipirellulaceae bacterium]
MTKRSLQTTLLAAAWLLLPLSAPAGSLRVLTYNIHHGAGTDGDFDLSRIASIITAANPDVVSLQECDNGVPRTNNVDEVARLAQLTGMQGYFAKTRPLDGGSYGDGVLIRPGISIVNSQNFNLPNPDNTEPRVVAELGLSIDSNPATAEFNFFATHLSQDSTAGRQQSATYINNLVASSTVPSILAGDMNFNPGSTAYNIMDNQWIDASSPTLSDNQIDYVWYRSSSQWNVTTPGAFIRNATTDVASDHHPLLAVLNLKTVWPGSALVWNINTGAATPVTDGFATGNGSAGVGDFPASPWSTGYDSGTQNLLIGYNGNATLSGNLIRTIGSLRIGTNQANTYIADRNGNGMLTVSGGLGVVVSKTNESTGDLIVGEGGLTGTMNWNSTSTLEVQGHLQIGQGGTGTFNQTAGTVTASNAAVRIGGEAGSVATYNISGGTLTTSADGTDPLQIASSGATGTLRVSGSAIVTHGAEMTIADNATAGSNGRLELLGSHASFHVGQLNNLDGGATGVRETIHWQADSGGITPIVVTGSGALTSNRVRLESSTELAGNTGGGPTLTGDGIALELDLSAINTSRTLTLIDNQTTDAIQGFFENGTTAHLYAEGSTIFGTGFNGTVNISYLGGTGNDVVLNLQAGVLAGDFNRDGVVDAADYVVWRHIPGAMLQGYFDWRTNFGATLTHGSGSFASVPEPSLVLMVPWAAALLCYRSRSNRT